MGGRPKPRAPPSAVPRNEAASARLPGDPGDKPNSGKRPLPTSTQKPGNREGNQRIPYARFLFTWHEPRARLKELQQGDVMFVHRSSQGMGHGANRCIKAAGIPALNDMLSTPVAGITHIDFADPFMGDRMKEARVQYWEGIKKGLEAEIQVLNEVAKMYSGPYNHPSTERLAILNSDLTSAKKALTAANKAKPDINDVKPHLDWPAVRMLSDWRCDGVLISVDDDVDIDDSDQPKVSRDDGVLLNVAIQGPTPCRNTAWQASNLREDHEYAPQHIDASIPPLEKVFAGIFWNAERSDSGKLLRVGFQYRLFSGRQLAVSSAGARASQRTDAVQNGPTNDDFKRLCGAWRVGSVMDNRLTTDVERMIQLNVCVEFWTLPMLWNAYVHEPDNTSSEPRRHMDMSNTGINVPP